MSARDAAAVVIGGGFYGAKIAIHLAERRGLAGVVLLEREPALLARASRRNQARIHGGYHYPRSFTTAYRSRINQLRFERDFASAVASDFCALYAIARRNSRVTARQFERFCAEIGAPLEPAPASLRALFDSRRIEQVFRVRESAFDADRLAELAAVGLARAGVEVRLDVECRSIERAPDGALLLGVAAPGGALQRLRARSVFNCTYSALNQFGGGFAGERVGLKHELAEVALVEAPRALAGLGITVMDGPFFSLTPFPPRGLHTLTHVRYTPHWHWTEVGSERVEFDFAAHAEETRVDRMLRDAERYVPAIRGARYVESMYEIKTVLAKNETDDGRPILFDRHPEWPHCYSILGGKLDNIYDVLERLDAEVLPGAASQPGAEPRSAACPMR